MGKELGSLQWRINMIVIDYNQVAIGAFMAELRNRSDVEVNLPLLRHMILNTIRSYNVKHKNKYGEVVIACDNRHYWRRSIFPYYKAGRKATRESSGMDWNSIFDDLNIVREELDDVFPYPVINVEGEEVIQMKSGDWVESISSLEYVDNKWSIYMHNRTEEKFKKEGSRIEMTNKELYKDLIAEFKILQDK